MDWVYKSLHFWACAIALNADYQRVVLDQGLKSVNRHKLLIMRNLQFYWEILSSTFTISPVSILREYFSIFTLSLSSLPALKLL
jgi:hypothetical protein